MKKKHQIWIIKLKKKKNYCIIDKKFLLIVLIIIVPIIYLYIFFSTNPELVSLNQRAKFFSMTPQSEYVNESNSIIIDGTETKGTVMTSIKIPNEFVRQKFTLKIEAIATRNWDYGIAGDLNVYISRNLRIEILVNNKLYKVLNYTKLPQNLYSDSVSYEQLNASDYNKKLSYTEFFDSDLSRNNIRIQLITQHQLYPKQEVFELYFYDHNYCLTVCIGDPDLIFYSITVIFLVIWSVFIIWIYQLVRNNKSKVI